MHVHWPDFMTAAAAISVVIWVYLLLGRGGFWRTGRAILRPHGEAAHGAVAVIMPARDEASVISQSVSSLLGQHWRGSLNVFVVDDHSIDDTAAVARDAARRLGKSDQLTVIQGAPLPSGWLGKVWAMHQGAECARQLSPDFLLFTDADIVHAPDSLTALVGKAESGGYDLTSVMVRLNCRSLAEKLLIPAFVFFFLKLYPPAWIADCKRTVAGAAGGCMLLRPRALDRAGGLGVIRNEVIDDCALARAVKRSGGSLWLGLSPSTCSIRRYGSFGEIGRMIARTAFKQLNHSVLMLFVALLGLTITYLVPPVALIAGALRGQMLPSVLGGAAWLLMAIANVPMVRYYDLHPAWALPLPLTAAFYTKATFDSAVRYWIGRGGEWKGRSQDAPVKPEV